MTAVTAEEVRRARAYLQSAGIPTIKVSPASFARAVKETGKTFRQTLNYLNLLISGGQGNGPSPIATAGKDRLDPQEALAGMTPTEKMRYENGAGD